MKVSQIKHLVPPVAEMLGVDPDRFCDHCTALDGAVPLYDIISGVLNSGPLPAEFLGEPYEDTKETPIDEVDPHASFGFDNFDRENYSRTIASRSRAEKRAQMKGDLASAGTPQEPTPATSDAPTSKE